MVSVERVGNLIGIAFVVAVLAVAYGVWDALSDITGKTLGIVMGFLSDFGSWVVAGFALGLIAIGALAWRNETARRVVGILWDVSCFWPRAGHALGPPSYPERAVPQLASRLRWLVNGERVHAVVLAAHSQGAILAAAALAQIQRIDKTNAETLGRIAFMTYGSPMLRLYWRTFPRLFQFAGLKRLVPHHEGQPDDVRPWTNLWRRTDPIGGPMRPVLAERTWASPGQLSTEPGDRRVPDPMELRMVES